MIQKTPVILKSKSFIILFVVSRIKNLLEPKRNTNATDKPLQY